MSDSQPIVTKSKSQRDTKRIITQAFGPDPPLMSVYPHLTDLGNAERFGYLVGEDVRWVDDWKKWHVWDGQRWARDRRVQLLRFAKGVVRRMYVEAAKEEDEKRRKAILAWAEQCEGRFRITAMLDLARMETPGVPEDFDADPMLLNVENGTLELRTGELREHRRDDMLSKLAPVEYIPDAECPQWLTFLDRIFEGNAERIGFVQRAVGYALTGDTSEDVLFILHGSGQNGKSTLIETIVAVLGDYALTSPTESLMVKKGGGGIPNDIARLKGARFVSAIETEEGQQLAESRIKQLTGGDSVTARFLYAEFFTFVPSFKLFLACNHRPVIRGTDIAIWRRIRLIPFDVAIPAHEQDKHLAEKLRTEAPAILAWAVKGCMEWQADGLGYPEDIRAATDGYRDEMDILKDFIDERCTIDARYTVGSARLYDAYRAWAESTRVEIIPQKEFVKRLEERGFERKRIADGMVWLHLDVGRM